MSPTQMLDSVADAVVRVFDVRSSRALTPRQANRQLKQFNRKVAERREATARLNSYQHRWSKISGDEIVDLIERSGRTRNSKPHSA